ncbi:MAG: DUF1638 domain-containing protein [Defluviitaleaceae bacterium]|nr:DUF1638 domain-containing protein [Defluviitaleaceae bacterium]
MPNRYKLIGCEILFREICLCAAQSKNIIDLEFMDKGLHDAGEKIMVDTLQKTIDNVDIKKYSALLLGYGLCNYGVKGLHARIPIIIPKAHDCITLFMGSREKYMDYFQRNPGTFFRTSGWLERPTFGIDGEENVMSQLGIQPDVDYSQYGEENVEFLMEILGNWVVNYKKQTYIDTGVGDSAAYDAEAKANAESQGLEYEKIEGDIRLIQELMDGNWNPDDFLVIPPEHQIAATYDESIMTYCPVK